MRPGQARLGAGVAALAGLWIAVYWWWDPSAEPAIRFDTASQTAPEPDSPPTTDPAPPPTGAGRSAGDEGPAPQPPEPAPAPAGVLPPDFYDYVVQEDDVSLQEIAEKLLGDPGDWVIIAQSNPMQDPSRLRPGQVWQIPLDEKNLQGVIVDADGAAIGPTPRAEAPAREEFVEYVVQPRDTLSQISERLYGTQRHARLLFELNRDRLKLRSPDSIRVGQTLQAPRTPPG